MRRGSKLVGTLWRWHRRIGLVAAIFLLLMSVSGVLLNHGNDLGLDRGFVSWAWLRAYYGDQPAERSGYALGPRWVTRSDAGMVYLDAREIAGCEGQLKGAIAIATRIVIACEQEMLLLTAAGELIESMRADAGLPLPLESIGVNGRQLVLRSQGAWRSLDTDTLSVGQTHITASDVQVTPRGVPPRTLSAQLGSRSTWLSWERLLLDLHSGRLFGRFGELVVDIAGVFFSVLALSGVTMWWLHRRSR